MYVAIAPRPRLPERFGAALSPHFSVNASASAGHCIEVVPPFGSVAGPGGRSGAVAVTTMTLEASLNSAPPSSRSREEALVDRLRRGELAAVGEAYDLHHEVVRRFARRLLDDEAASEDLVQEVFVALPRAARRFRGDSSLRTFLVSIAVNLCRRHVRSASRRRKTQKSAELEPLPTAHAYQQSDPEREVQRRQLAELLSRALDQLSLEHRVAFVLCEVEARTSGEVSRIMDVPEGTVRTRLMHARKKLRRLLEKEGVA